METGYLNDHSKTAESVFDAVRPNWLKIFQYQYASIVDTHADTIKLQTFGHEHVDNFRLMGSKTILFSVPSLSTVSSEINDQKNKNSLGIA